MLPSGFLRFWGTAEMHESGPIHDAIFAKLTKREQEHVGADTGIGVSEDKLKLIRDEQAKGKLVASRQKQETKLALPGRPARVNRRHKAV